MQPLEVINNEQRQQFQVSVEGETAFMEYRFKDGVIVLMHTEVPEQLSGRGIATALVEFAFDYALKNNFPVKIYCPFVLMWLKRHPERAGQLVK